MDMSLDSEKEKDLAKMLRAGDLSAFEKLISIHENKIFNYLYRLVGSRADAEDLTQEVFIKLYKHKSRIDPEKNLKSWLYTVATNAANDWFRARKGYSSYSLYSEEGSSLETIRSDPAYYYIERTIDIAAALEKLKPMYKTALLLFYKEGLNYTEISEVLRVPVNTVKTYLRRAKEALKQELGDDYEK